MKELLYIMKEKKIIPLIALVLLILFVAWSVFWAMNKPKENPENEEQINAEVTLDADIKTNDVQNKLIRKYGEDELKIVRILTSTVWQDVSEIASITFSDTVMSEQKGDDITSKSYAIAAILDDTAYNEDSTYECYILALQLEKEIQLVKLCRLITNEAAIQDWTVESTGFKNAKAYTKKEIADALVVSDMSEDVSKLFVSEYKVKQAITDYALIYYPQATTATWEGTITMNANYNLIETRYLLDLKTKTFIKVKYHTDTEEIEVE